LHAEARAWLETVFTEEPLIGLPWQSIGAFLRVTTNPRLSVGTMSVDKAAAIVDSWLQLPNVRLLTQGERHWPILRRAMLDSQLRGPKLTDVQLAALAIEYGGVLCTTDRDFARFPALRWKNPLMR
jgi:hypothetical protein